MQFNKIQYKAVTIISSDNARLSNRALLRQLLTQCKRNFLLANANVSVTFKPDVLLMGCLDLRCGLQRCNVAKLPRFTAN